MTEAELLDLARETMVVLLKVSAPALLVGLVVGLLISILQTLTQLMEQTLTFVPKLLAISMTLLLFGSFMLEGLITFTRHIMDRVVSGGGA